MNEASSGNATDKIAESPGTIDGLVDAISEVIAAYNLSHPGMTYAGVFEALDKVHGDLLIYKGHWRLAQQQRREVTNEHTNT